jgi:ferredoxin hydrogenase large subunit
LKEGGISLKGLQRGEVSKVIEINENKCKGCDGCKSFCPTNAVAGKYGAVHRIDKEKCIACGQCLVNCPFGAPFDVIDPVDTVIEKLKNKQIMVVSSIAPSVRVAIGEEFGFENGSLETKRLYGGLKKAGFTIGDANYAADLCIMEEGSELIEKIKHYMLHERSEHHLGAVPQFTSCCPAWVRYLELNYPQLIPNLSSAKSPMMMHGALIKTYGPARLWKTNPENIFVVGIMPCTAKKFEASRPEFTSAADYWSSKGKPGKYPDVDTVLTTRDLARLFKKLGIDLATVPEFDDRDNPMGAYSGAGTIFGNSGGVMEAALRTAYFEICGKELDALEFTLVRGLKGVKAAEVVLKHAKSGKNITIRIAVVNGIKENIKLVLDQVVAGSSPYHFIEVMNCPGGCVNGGGQPINSMGTSWLNSYKMKFPWS